jgi:hypothetical protein
MMTHQNNDYYIQLLKQDPNQLIVELQDLIDIIILQFVRSGSFNSSEKTEIKQNINFELLNKISKIQTQYQGKSLLTTYFSVIIKNLCNEMLRNKKNVASTTTESITIAEEPVNLYSMIFEEEIIRLNKIINLYPKQKFKMILCLKLKYKMKFEFQDFNNALKEFTLIEFENFEKSIDSYFECNDNIIFEKLISIFNLYENKDNSPDSLRKWITEKINELIDILNGNPPTSKYDKETLQILFEKSYHTEYKIINKLY